MPKDTLVQRLRERLDYLPINHARDAIQEVAAWLRENDYDWDGSAAALEREAQ